MLTYTKHGESGPFLFLLHWLGGSSRTWTEVSSRIAARGFQCFALDLPGFGCEDGDSPVSVDDYLQAIIPTIVAIRRHDRSPWLLAGHSMGGKFAAIIARASVEGRKGLEQLHGLALVSPSPPAPEPMEERTRQHLIETFRAGSGSTQEDRRNASEFIDNNTGKLPLLQHIHARAVDDVLRSNRAAFVGWLTIASKEDWASRVGTLSIPTLLLAGTEEEALGLEAQQMNVVPHFTNSTLVALEGAGHLAPLERSAEVAERILKFAQTVGFTLQWPSLKPGGKALIGSEFTSHQTRQVLEQRIVDDHAPLSGVLNEDERLALLSIAEVMIPGCSFDLTPRVDRWLALPQHDGWRYASLPADIVAWKAGLCTLQAAAIDKYQVPFIALDSQRQGELLSLAENGRLDFPRGDQLDSTKNRCLTNPEMKLWFGDLHAELTKIYVADPRTMERIGFTGFADEQGFTNIRLNERESFEQ